MTMRKAFQTMSDKFIDLLRESTLVQGSITLVLIVTICYLYITSQPVPEELYALLLVVMGFWFGNKINYQTRQLATKLQEYR